MRETNFKYYKLFIEDNYLKSICEKVFEDKNYKENSVFKKNQERMVFETEIWMIGEDIRQGILKERKNKTENYLKILDKIIEIITIEKYRKGRESFVMLLSYYKNNNEVKNLLEKLLDDNKLYGFAINELNKLKEYNCINKITEIYNNEKNGWIKRDAKKYIENKNRSTTNCT
jgi:hypothetical protein